MAEVTIICKKAQERYRNALLWLKLWSFLLWIFGAALVAFLILAIFLYIRQDWLEGGLSTLTSIVSGAAIKWVVDRRTIAVEEEKEAFKEVEESCVGMVRRDNVRTVIKV